ncbi:MAG: Flp family type IVb pilin [Candidatus Eiseniibacteriota bacterium]
MFRRLGSFVSDETGQDLIEYALLAAFIAIVSILALTSLGLKVKSFYELVGSKF